MKKFIIDKINIDKSDKDIQTGISYEFIQGINFICGNNEAGKSSLMKFIKEGFFKLSKTDTGKIFFKVNDEPFRADIKVSKQKNERCKIYNNLGIVLNYEILEKFINQKYFEQGFTISLDDLTSLKYDNEMTLVNVIKDPSGDKLNTLMVDIKSKITECIGDKGKPKNPITKITERIKDINLKINALSNKEEEYNKYSELIKEFNEELQFLNDKETYIKQLIKERENKQNEDRLNLQIKNKTIEFNHVLYSSKDEYSSLTQDTGKYISNLEIINKYKYQLENLNNKIKEKKQKLQNDFEIPAEEAQIANFEINFEKINTIKVLKEEINRKNNEILAYQKNIENIEDTILKLENDYKFILKEAKNLSSDKLTEFFLSLENGLQQIKSLEYDINDLKQTENKTIGIVISELIILSIITISSIVCAAYFFNINKFIYSSVFLILAVIIIFLIMFISKNNSFKSNIERKQNLKTNIIKQLYEQIEKYYPEKINHNNFNIVQPDEIKQGIQIIINKITQNKTDYEYNKSRIQKINEKISILKNEITQVEDQIVKITENDIGLNSHNYIDAVHIIKNLKEEIANKINIEKDIIFYEKNNTDIINNFNYFIKEKEICINLSSDLKENFEKLRQYNEHNNEVKKEIDTLRTLLDNIKFETIPFDFKEKYNEITISSNLEFMLNETKKRIHHINEEKHKYEVEKSKLEEVESITDLKNKKNILTDEYRNLIEEIITSKAIINITSKAKNNFDKTQPDLVNAQKYLKILTNGKYSKINLESEEIESSDALLIKKWNELSRGTKEQLYLALRLGYASNYTIKDERRPSLPLIIDDALVNFDEERTKSAINCLLEFSKTNQVLFFTCHTETIKKYLESISIIDSVKIIHI